MPLVRALRLGTFEIGYYLLHSARVRTEGHVEAAIHLGRGAQRFRVSGGSCDCVGSRVGGRERTLHDSAMGFEQHAQENATCELQQAAGDEAAGPWPNMFSAKGMEARMDIGACEAGRV